MTVVSLTSDLVTRLLSRSLGEGWSHITHYFCELLTSSFLLLTFLRPSAASLSKSSAEVCARLHRDAARNPPKYSRRTDTPPDSPPTGGNENACTSRAKARDFSGQPVRTGPSKLAP